MSIQAVEIDGHVEVFIHGNFSFKEYSTFIQLMESHEGQEQFIIHMNRISFMDSTGMGLLLLLQERVGERGRVTLANPSQRVREMLQVAHFDKIFKIIEGLRPQESVMEAS
uniref:Putative Anti-sigma-factor antagonist n=1 Tax=Magnetococcus massalia (strain MO-1) TaxID=451514 RepID=A0A1S7LKD9_MAGMO|nr:putative Anti-sigma-factor antagonist [Candidatus Magnetococcus massalia]